jgi:membrane-bound lytic murein transglycosylase A
MSRFLAAAALALILPACAARVVPPATVQAPPPPPVAVVAPPRPVAPLPRPQWPALPRAPLPEIASGSGAAGQASQAGLRPGPTVASLQLAPAAAARALATFRVSCPAVTRRDDRTGLTRPTDWADACAAAARWPDGDAATFFATYFETVEVGTGSAFATGYYEPEIRGCRTRMPGCEVPIYAAPPDRRAFSRAQIEDGALAGRNLEIAYAADAIDLFFMQIQGSGRLRLPDGGVMRLGYAAQNGREYVAIGRLLRDRGILPRDQISLQTIQAWMRANPTGGRALMRENPSYVFFRELTGPGPLGSLGLPVTPRGTVAVDPRFVTYGAPVLLSVMSDERADGLWVAQDTGGAIRGANRFDTFWGAGAEAERIAGPMQATGRALLLLPRGTLERLARNAPAQR